MKNRWTDSAPSATEDLVAACAYASRLLGQERSLVLYGGGNSSVKQKDVDPFGDMIETLWVKGSGTDMAALTPEGFSPLRLETVRRMADAESMSDGAMKNELRSAMLDAESPAPSVEAMVHAAIPHAAVLHTHPDALLAISNTADGHERIASLYGDTAIIVPYTRSGFRVGRATAAALRSELTESTVAVVLMNHGIFTFGDTPHQAYDRMISLVTAAEDYLEEHVASSPSQAPESIPGPVDMITLADLREKISAVAGRPFILERHTDPASWAFSQRTDLTSVAGRGPITPDHVIWTKTLPMFGRDVDGYAEAYRSYYEGHKDRIETHRMLDAAPRVVFDAELGMLTSGPTVAAADAARDVYLQTMDVIEDAEGLGGYEARPHADFFDVEYWELEQAKIKNPDADGEFAGEVALVTGAASGIGRACAAELLARGAAVIGLDLSPKVSDAFTEAEFVGIECDLTDADATETAIQTGVERFGGIDMVVAAAGMFPESSPIADHDPGAWRKAMAVNVDALALLMSLVHPLLVRSPAGARITVIGSKNVTAPGPGASAYSASKAAANQLTRVAALEWAPDGIRVNSVHPDAVFDTGLWTDELLAERASRYGLTIDEYKRRNLMGIEITSADVANVVAETFGDSFSRVTGAHIPIDGGNDRVI